MEMMMGAVTLWYLWMADANHNEYSLSGSVTGIKTSIRTVPWRDPEAGAPFRIRL